MNRDLEFATNFKENPSSFQYLLQPSRFDIDDGFEFGSSSTHGSHKRVPIFGGFSFNPSPIPYSFYDPLIQNHCSNGIPKASNSLELDISNGTKNTQTTSELPKLPQMQVKGRWTPEEDSELKRLVKLNGKKEWTNIASLIGGRGGKQCRERWENHLDPTLKKEKWSEEEEKNLIVAHKQVGTRWAELARRIPGRSENSIKNLWNSIKRRMAIMQSGKSESTRLSPLEAYINFLISYQMLEVDQWINPKPEPEVSDTIIKSSSSITMPNSDSENEVVEEEDDVFKVDAYYPVFPNAKASFQNAEEFDEQKEMDFLEMLIHSY